MNKSVRAYAKDTGMIRPEPVEIKNTIKGLKRDAEASAAHLTLVT